MSDLVLLLAGLAVGAGIAAFGKRTKRGREALGVLLDYEDGRKARDLNPTELIGFAVLILSFGGLCVWGLFRYFEG